MKEINREALLNATTTDIEATINKYTDKIYIRTETDGNSSDTETSPTEEQRTNISTCIKSVVSCIRHGFKTRSEFYAIMNCAEFTAVQLLDDGDETAHINTYLSFYLPCIEILKEYGIEI